MLTRHVLLVAALLTALGAAGHARAQPPSAPEPTLIVDATVLEVQPDVPHCGILAVAGWARIRVEAIQTPIGGFVPPELVVMVQCPTQLSVGARRRFELVSRRPTDGDWTMYTVFTRPSGPAPAFWTLRLRAIP